MEHLNPSRVWLITGCSSGFGKILSRYVLRKGERVVATARNLETLKDLQTEFDSAGNLICLRLDVTKADDRQNAIRQALEKFGRCDILVNNAGYGVIGALEEVTEEQTREIFETNVFGLIEMTKACLPQLRKQKSGQIFNLSSVAGMAAIAGAGIYSATKFAVEGLSEALALELKTFGIKVTLLEPGGFRTDFAGRSLKMATYSRDYDEALKGTRKFYETISGNQPGDPEKFAAYVFELSNAESPPLRAVMGKIADDRVSHKLAQYELDRKTWKAKGDATDFDV